MHKISLPFALFLIGTAVIVSVVCAQVAVNTSMSMESYLCVLAVTVGLMLFVASKVQRKQQDYELRQKIILKRAMRKKKRKTPAV
jgi:membrane protein YdbS with pleckstrin-like domain